MKDNILLPFGLSRRPISEMMQKLVVTCNELGINSLQEKFPYEISGNKSNGQQARAIITERRFIMDLFLNWGAWFKILCGAFRCISDDIMTVVKRYLWWRIRPCISR